MLPFRCQYSSSSFIATIDTRYVNMCIVGIISTADARIVLERMVSTWIYCAGDGANASCIGRVAGQTFSAFCDHDLWRKKETIVVQKPFDRISRQTYNSAVVFFFLSNGSSRLPTVPRSRRPAGYRTKYIITAG